MLKREIETDGSPVRLTKTKCAILGECAGEFVEGLTFTRKPRGKVEIKWMGYIPVAGVELEKCSLGHEHSVPKLEHWVWNYCTLDQRDVDRLREFLL